MAGTSVENSADTMRAGLLFVVVGGMFVIPLLTFLSLAFSDTCGSDSSALVCRSTVAWNVVVLAPLAMWLGAIGLGLAGQRQRRTGKARPWIYASWALFVTAIVVGVAVARYLDSLPG
jgi:hypothetical protein